MRYLGHLPPALSELKQGIREGRAANGSYAMNPYGPPPNYTNGGWSRWNQGMNAAFTRGLRKLTEQQPEG